MIRNYIDQRDTYKLVERIISRDYPDEITMLKSLVKEVVELDQFEIIGGRIWKLNPKKKTYSLIFQHGKFNKIPEHYEIEIDSQPILKKLATNHVMLSNETDFVLKELGIKLYSVIGVGDIIKLKSDKFYEYAIGFNAPEIHESFNQLLNIISGVSTNEIITIREKTFLRDQVDSSKRIRRDLEKASEIQRQLLPNHEFQFDDFDIYGLCYSSDGVGGDFFDYILREDVENQSLGIVISDAASNGLPAAVQSLFVSGAIRMGLSYATRFTDVFAKLNTLIFDTFVYERFVTLFYCEITLSENRLVLYVNAGHPGPIHYRPSIDRVRQLMPTGGLLGIMREQKFALENISMKPGDILVLFTDGITEAMDEHNEMFGEERVISAVKKYHDKSAKEMALLIIEEVEKFAAKSSHKDDKTIVVVKRKQKTNSDNNE